MLETCTSEISFSGGNPQWASDYMHARYYSPHLGRFLSTDPAGGNPGEPQSWNRYAYVQNNPMNYVDPTGMFGVSGFSLFANQYKAYSDSLTMAQFFGTTTVASSAWKFAPGLNTGSQAGLSLAGGRAFLDSLMFTTASTALLVNQNVVNADRNVPMECLALSGFEECYPASRAVMPFGPGTSLGALAGKPYPVKTRYLGRPQPYNPANGRYLSPKANPGLGNSPIAEFTYGVGQGFAGDAGADGLPMTTSTPMRWGQATGRVLSSLLNLFN